MKKMFKLILAMFIALNTAVLPKKVFASENVLSFDELEYEVISYEEMIENIAANRNITLEEAQEMFPDVNENNTRSSVTYQYVSSYRLVDVTSSYKPRLYFYLYMGYQNGSPVEIKRVVDFALNRTNYLNNSISSKKFDGTLRVELLDAKNLYYRLDGDFYNNGTFKAGAGGTIEVGAGKTMNFTVEYASDHYKYIFKTETLSIIN